MIPKSNVSDCIEQLQQRLERTDYKYDAVFRIKKLQEQAKSKKTVVRGVNANTGGNNNGSISSSSTTTFGGQVPQRQTWANSNLATTSSATRTEVSAPSKMFDGSKHKPIQAVNNVAPIKEIVNNSTNDNTGGGGCSTIEISDNSSQSWLSTAKKRRRFVIDDDDDDDEDLLALTMLNNQNPRNTSTPSSMISSTNKPSKNERSNIQREHIRAQSTPLQSSTRKVLQPKQQQPNSQQQQSPNSLKLEQTNLVVNNYQVMSRICDMLTKIYCFNDNNSNNHNDDDQSAEAEIDFVELLQERQTFLKRLNYQPMFSVNLQKPIGLSTKQEQQEEKLSIVNEDDDEDDHKSHYSPPLKRHDSKVTPVKARTNNWQQQVKSQSTVSGLVQSVSSSQAIEEIDDDQVDLVNSELDRAPPPLPLSQPQSPGVIKIDDDDDDDDFRPIIFNPTNRPNKHKISNNLFPEDEPDVILLSDDEEEEKILPQNSKKDAIPEATNADIDIDLDDMDWGDWSDIDEVTSAAMESNTCTKNKEEDDILSLNTQSTTKTSGGDLLSAALQASTSFVEMDLNRSLVHDNTHFERDSFDKSDLSTQPRDISINAAPRFFGLYQNDGNEAQLKSHKLPHSKKMFEVFHQLFNLREFRTNQLEAINAALLGHDVFVLMPTGGGKSLCYQLPAMVSQGVSIIVSPLKSLILDQTTKMNDKREGSAAALSGDIDTETSNSIYADLRSKNPTIKLLYVTPEKLSASGALSSILTSLYERKLLERFVIDEAHCVSQWGHDFRPDYKKLSKLRTAYRGVPFIALTATATQKVRLDIAAQLGLKQAKWFMQSFNRNNLKFEVRAKKKNSLEEICQMMAVEFPNQTGIIYCLSRKDCDDLAQKLRYEGFKSTSYHAGLTDVTRRKIQEDWISGRFNVVVATIAFGMGIDKSDVRFVIHYSMPKSVEGYYQEVGRAGRDGKLAFCILYYTGADFNRWKSLMKKTSTNQQQLKMAFDYLYDVQQFCLNKAECRRKQLLKYFGEQYDDRLCLANLESVCDNCLVKDHFKEEDFTQTVKLILESIRTLVGPYGATQRSDKITPTQLLNILCDTKDPYIRDAHRRTPAYGICRQLVRADVSRLIQNLIAQKFLAEDTVFNTKNIFASSAYIRLGERASDILLRGQVFKFSITDKKNAATSSTKTSTSSSKVDAATRGKGKATAKTVQASKISKAKQAKLNVIHEFVDDEANDVDNDEFNDEYDFENSDELDNSLDDFVVDDDQVSYEDSYDEFYDHAAGAGGGGFGGFQSALNSQSTTKSGGSKRGGGGGSGTRGRGSRVSKAKTTVGRKTNAKTTTNRGRGTKCGTGIASYLTKKPRGRGRGGVGGTSSSSTSSCLSWYKTGSSSSSTYNNYLDDDGFITVPD